MHKFLSELNETQQQAVINYKGPGLIIAGAGAGKTRVLTYRIAYLLSQGVKASNILALTFTNKAAKEMKERISSLIGPETVRYLWMGTFHSIFARILRIEADKLGYDSNFTIYDTADSRNLIKTIIKDLNLDDQQYKPNTVQSRISWAKNELITAQTYYNNTEITEADKYSRRPFINEIYKEYVRRCFRAGAMDFDDLLLNTNMLLSKFPDIKEKYSNKFNYVLVDEYQDTNYSQYLIVKELSKSHKNICVVGDDAQSIYSFRGARIENILNFKNDYPDYTLYKLERNYRSTQNIVEAANSIIEKNKNQIQKKVFSEKEAGDKIKITRTLTDNEEGYIVANTIMENKLNYQLKNNDFAILYRTNAQSRIFEESLRKLNIPYKIYGGLSFYQRKEIKDLLAYLKLIVNYKDNEAFKRIINYPARGIGKTTINKLELASNKYDLNLWQIAQNPQKYEVNINAGTASKISRFIEFISSFKSKLENTDAYDLAHSVASSSGILKEFYQDKTPENISRHENIQELLNGIKEFTINEYEENKVVSLTDYLENVSLLTSMDNEKEEDLDKVTLMTIHSAKGLEFNTVFIVGMEENLFPSQLSNSTMKELEEERRLFYVALTRAEQNVFISYALSRFKWGQLTDCTPSRFIKEIDEKYLDVPEFNENSTNNNLYDYPDFSKPLFRNKNVKSKNTPTTSNLIKNKKLIKINSQTSKTKPTSNIEADDPTKIQTGMEVEHSRFGVGKVLVIEGEMPNKKATIFFQAYGQKQLLLKFAKLKIVSD
ncbi:MAG: UvrD-helicase domain-containing protein [Chlorobi bacterium]|nr:UvrD-helicase domain-containing protein [Chlorobiota bacterium]